jgi:hypothetical protein
VSILGNIHPIFADIFRAFGPSITTQEDNNVIRDSEDENAEGCENI